MDGISVFSVSILEAVFLFIPKLPKNNIKNTSDRKRVRGRTPHHRKRSTFSKNRKAEKRRKMEIYEKVSTNLNFVEREKATRAFWEKNGVFEKSITEREGCDNYPDSLYLFCAATVFVTVFRILHIDFTTRF